MNNISAIAEVNSSRTGFVMVNPPIVAQFYLWGYLMIFILGFTSNIASFLTFIQPTLRSVSTGTLFIVLAISDALFLFASIFDFIDFGLQVPLGKYVQHDVLCRYRVFVSSTTQMCSAWTLVIISIDRWIRLRFPYRAKTLCTPRKALIAVAVIVVLDGGVHSNILGTLAPSVAIAACGLQMNSKMYLYFYYFTWTIMQIFINYLIPVVLMLLTLIDMFFSIHRQRRVLSEQRIGFSTRKSRFEKQLVVLMLSNVIIFTITTLPLAIYRIVFPEQIIMIGKDEIEVAMSILAGLTWFCSFNYAINFYIHCLTSRLFREEFNKLVERCIPRRNQATVAPIFHFQTKHYTRKQYS